MTVGPTGKHETLPMGRLLRYFLVGFVLVQAVQISLAGEHLLMNSIYTVHVRKRMICKLQLAKLPVRRRDKKFGKRQHKARRRIITSHGENGSRPQGPLYSRYNTKIRRYNTQNSYIIILRFPMPWRSAL